MIEYQVQVFETRTEWFLNGKYHRENGPAVEYDTGYKVWYKNGKLHRADGPAIEFANGDRWWFLNGERHREDGPAIEKADGDKFWYLDGVEVSESDVMNPHKELTVKEIEDLLGFQVKIVK